MFKKVSLGLIALSFFLAPIVASAQSTAVQAQLAVLLAQLAQLQQQISQVQSTQGVVNTPSGSSAIPCPNPSLTRGLSRGDSGTDVAALQGFLINAGYLTGTNVTGYFGALTEAALQKFQSANGVVSSGTPDTTGYGAAGPKTRYAIMQVCTSGYANTQVSTPPPSTYVPPPTYVTPTQSSATFATFTASPSQIIAGQQSVLTWNVQNASGCVLSQQVPGQASATVNVNLPVSGTAIVTPPISIVYTIVCTAIGIQNLGAIQSVGVTVTSIPTTATTTTATNNPMVSVSVSPTVISVGNTATITWNAPSASSCSLTSNPNIFSANSISGSQSGAFNSVGTTEFTFICMINGQSYASSAHVVANPIAGALIATPTSGTTPLSVAFSGNTGVSYSNGLSLDYGDGTNATVCASGTSCNTFNATHTYTTAGTYTAKLTNVGNSYNTSLGSVTITTSAPASGSPTLTSDMSTYTLGNQVLATWNNPGTTNTNDWVTDAPQGTTWTSSTFPTGQPKLITDGAHSWTKPLIPTAAGTYVLQYYSQGGYSLVAQSAPFTVNPLVYQLWSDKSTVPAGNNIAVSWVNPAVPQANDWLTMVPSGAHYTSSTWPTNAFPNVYTGGTATGTKIMTSPTVVGSYDLVYYSNNTFTELARSTSTVMIIAASPMSCLQYTFPACPTGQHNVITTTSYDSNDCPVKTNSCVND